MGMLPHGYNHTHRLQKSGNSDTQLIFDDLHRIGADGLGCRAVYLLAVKCVGGFVHTAALDSLGSRHIVQPAVSQVGALVVEGPVLFVLPKNHQNPCRQVPAFESDCRARSRQLGNPVEADGQLTGVIVPATFVLWFACRADAENPLPNFALQKLHGHGCSLVGVILHLIGSEKPVIGLGADDC